MTVGGGFRRLTRILRRLEGAGWTIEDVRPAADGGLCDGGAIRTVVACRFAGEGTPEPPGARTLDLDDPNVDVHPDRLETGRGGPRARISVDIRPPEATDAAPGPDRTGRPLHRDPDRLRSLYRTQHTFAEMAEAVDADVSAETIRRYMIEHGIHEPGSAGRERGPPGPPTVLADGIGLPAEMGREALIEAVAGANTVYDVQRHLELEREEVAGMLRELGLMDLVLGRLGDGDARPEREREIRRRLAAAGRSEFRNR